MSATTAADITRCERERRDKHYATLRAIAARAGYALYRSDPCDGAVAYFAARWGLIHALADLDQVERWLERATGQAA